MAKIVTGVGTRKLPSKSQDSDLYDVVRVFCFFATKMGWILRSGGADGADILFESLWNTNKEIYIHNERVGNRRHGVDGAIYVDGLPQVQASQIALSIHPNPQALRRKASSLALHTRNIFQVLSPTLNCPSDLIVYYAPFDMTGEEVTGGTRTAVVLSKQWNIPQFNLILPDDRRRLIEFVACEYELYKEQNVRQ